MLAPRFGPARAPGVCRPRRPPRFFRGGRGCGPQDPQTPDEAPLPPSVQRDPVQGLPRAYQRVLLLSEKKS